MDIWFDSKAKIKDVFDSLRHCYGNLSVMSHAHFEHTLKAVKRRLTIFIIKNE